MTDVERLLHYALTPVDPPRDMVDRFERRLTELTDAALDEIAEFDPAAVRSPRRWARVAAAGVVAGAGAGALVLVRARQQHKSKGDKTDDARVGDASHALPPLSSPVEDSAIQVDAGQIQS